MNWLKENLFIVVLARLVGALLICTILFLAYAGFQKEKGVISIKLENAQLARLKELSKQDFRDVEHTMLMLADQYIEYNNEVKK